MISDIIGKKTGIYKIVNPNGAIYIGQSRDISKRRTSYRGASKNNKGQPKLYNSLLKYGGKNHTFEVIQECEIHELNIMEYYWQEYYNACSRENLNCTLTNITDKVQVVSDETRKKQSDATKVRMKRLLKDPEYLKTMRTAYDKRIGVKIKPKTEAQKEAKRQAEIRKGNWKGAKNPWFGVDRSGEKNTMYGRTQSPETRAKIGAIHKGRKASLEAREKMSTVRMGGKNARAKLILNTDTGIYYDCGKDAWGTLSKYAFSTFRSKMNGKIKTGLPFKYI